MKAQAQAQQRASTALDHNLVEVPCLLQDQVSTSPNEVMRAPLEVKSKFDAEFRRFAIRRSPAPSHMELSALLERLHGLAGIPFNIAYTDAAGDLLPITNDQNFAKALTSARPVLRLQIARLGELWDELYQPKVPSKGLLGALGLAQPAPRRPNISLPEEFRVVSAIIDVDVVPESQRRVRLCKHGSDRPLGFYIRDGTSVRVTPQGSSLFPSSPAWPDWREEEAAVG